MCKCQSCNELFGTDFILSDELWDKIKPIKKPKGCGLLCPKCIGSRIEMLGGYKAFFVTEI